MKKYKAMEWVKALRSGVYRQGKKVLYDKTKDSYCCLGILALLSSDSIETTPYTRGYLNNKALCGLWSGDGSIEDGVTINEVFYRSLASANDGGVSFNDIADWIEKNYEKL